MGTSSIGNSASRNKRRGILEQFPYLVAGQSLACMTLQFVRGLKFSWKGLSRISATRANRKLEICTLPLLRYEILLPAPPASSSPPLMNFRPQLCTCNSHFPAVPPTYLSGHRLLRFSLAT